MTVQLRCRAVVTDLDGTIVRDDGTVSEATVNAAVELGLSGIPLVAATARTPEGIKVLDALIPHLAFAVCCGGVLGWSPADGRVLWQDTIASATVRKIVRLATTHLAREASPATTALVG